MTARWPIALVAWLLVVSVLAACNTQPKASAEAGRDLYGQNGCGSCHGPEGHGDGPVSRTMEPRPRDFRNASAFKQGLDVASIAETIATGVIPGPAVNTGSIDQAHHHSQVMPRFDHLSDSERRSLALYVISLRNPATREGNQP